MNYRPCSYCQSKNLENPLILKWEGTIKKGDKYYSRKKYHCRECNTNETSTTDKGVYKTRS